MMRTGLKACLFTLAAMLLLAGAVAWAGDDVVASSGDVQLGAPVGGVGDVGSADEGQTAAALDDEVTTSSFSRAGYVADIPLGAHQSRGVATIIDDTHIQLEHFYYDGTAPAVYFYLGTEDAYSAFFNGLEVPPMLNGAYFDDSFVLTLPAGETIAGYHAISVWCAEFHVNFTSASFLHPNRGDLNCDGAVDNFDIDAFVMALTSAAHAPPFDTYDVMWPGCDGTRADIDGDGEVNLFDVDPFVAMLTGG